MPIKNFRLDDNTYDKVMKSIGNRSESDWYREAVVEKLDREEDYLQQLYNKKDKLIIEINKIEQQISDEESKRYGNNGKKIIKTPEIKARKRDAIDNAKNYSDNKAKISHLVKLKTLTGLISNKEYLSQIAETLNIDYEFLLKKIKEEYGTKSVM